MYKTPINIYGIYITEYHYKNDLQETYVGYMFYKSREDAEAEVEVEARRAEGYHYEVSRIKKGAIEVRTPNYKATYKVASFGLI